MRTYYFVEPGAVLARPRETPPFTANQLVEVLRALVDAAWTTACASSKASLLLEQQGSDPLRGRHRL